MVLVHDTLSHCALEILNLGMKLMNGRKVKFECAKCTMYLSI